MTVESMGIRAKGRVGVDSGGTFTDVVTAGGAIWKVLSTPADPAAAVRAAVDLVGGTDVLAHGTTVATNALLERRGAPVALYATAGHTDVIEIARQVRPSLYDPFVDRPEPLVPRHRRFGVPGRLDRDGREIEALGEVEMPADGGAAAVVLLHADRNDTHERALGRRLEDLGLDVSLSSEISPEYREYERTVTTVLNGYLRPVCRRYLLDLASTAREVLVMTSAGGLVPVAEAAERPVSLLLSGHAGGVLAAAAAAAAAGFPDAVTLDMGGTSTDVCLIIGGRPGPASQRLVAGLPVRIPSLDVFTIGAGGGSIASIDSGGALVVGPESAGADPGPACYGRGGQRPTVTDANVVAGRIPPGLELPGLGPLDLEAAREALQKEGLSADGILTVVNAHMVQAIRRVSVERGKDPRGLALVAFGGAGPLHACALAEALDMPAVVVPARAGVLSAVGMLCGPRQVDLVRSWPVPADHDGARRALGELAGDAVGRLGEAADVEVVALFDCRYAGQSHELAVPSVEDFAAEHERRNGFARPDATVEIIALRVSARCRSPIDFADLPDPGGRSGAIRGPGVISESDCTMWVAEGWTATPGGGGAWVLTR